MVQKVDAWTNSKGRMFKTERDALLSEIEITLGKHGESGGAGEITVSGAAALIADNAESLVPILQQISDQEKSVAQSQ